MSLEFCLSTKFWGELVLHTSYLIIIIPALPNDGNTPFRMLYGPMLNISKLEFSGALRTSIWLSKDIIESYKDNMATYHFEAWKWPLSDLRYCFELSGWNEECDIDEMQFPTCRDNGGSTSDTDMLTSSKFENHANSASDDVDMKSILAQEQSQKCPEFVVSQGDNSEGNL